MRIRAGFVSNSSSTSFLIITREELQESAFLELMGVSPESPIAGLFRELFSDVMDVSKCVDFSRVRARTSPESWFDTTRMSAGVVARIRDAAKRGLKAYYGHLSSDGTLVQQFFCTDAFEVENERIYFNYLQCVW